MKQLQIQQNRRATRYSKREQFARILWGFGRILFSASPRPCFGFRRWLLRCFGAKIGSNVHIYPSVHVYFPWLLVVGCDSAIGDRVQIYNLGPCTIGSRATVSQGAHLCGGTHDYNDPAMTLIKCSITIGDDSWVCADAFVGPDVQVGQGAVAGARSVVTKNVDPWTVVAGNPAKKIGDRHLRDAGEAESRSLATPRIDESP